MHPRRGGPWFWPGREADLQRFLTTGHGTAEPDDLTALFAAAGVERVVDVRRFPGSRRDPRVSREAMSRWLPAAGFAYAWEPRLGGRRRVPKDQDPHADGWWRVEAFRAYAAHTRTDEFRAALDDLVGSRQGTTVLMCSESLWWRCHRRLVADALVLLADVPVEHLAHDGTLSEHLPSEGATVVDGRLHYPPAG